MDEKELERRNIDSLSFLFVQWWLLALSETSSLWMGKKIVNIILYKKNVFYFNICLTINFVCHLYTHAGAQFQFSEYDYATKEGVNSVIKVVVQQISASRSACDSSW